jgi:hypothetical protein
VTVAQKMTRTELKRKAQEALMQGIANQLGYYDPNDFGEDFTEEQKDELHAVMKREADRVARLFGYEKAWSS